MANVRLLRMVSGEDVVCTVIKNTEDTITIKDAIVAIPTGQGQLGFAPWSPIISKEESEITISERFVIYQAEPDSSVVEQYNTMFGNVIAPKKQSIIV
jgi:hypothetical protein